MWFTFALIATSLWAFTNVVESMIVKRYERNPIVVLWFSGFVKLLFLAGLPLMVDVRTSWMPVLLLAGFLFYIGALAYYFVIGRVDISVTNAAWAIQAIFLSVVGIVLFGEQWSPLQSVGVVLILSGVFTLSYWHKHVSIIRTVLLLSLVALLFTPEESLKKAALLDGQSVFAVIYWTLLGHASLAFLVPQLFPSYRGRIRALLGRADTQFFLFYCVSICVDLLAVYFLICAYAVGPLSLVSITFSSQPFLVIIIAWMFMRFIPTYAPRELLSVQSVQVKLISFLVVFTGLSLLAIG